ncbi:MAG: hypothetical protein M1325_04395 [Actinobacteria bacterium]|nr:hypothetical protein [Actinomycetota bacterium]
MKIKELEAGELGTPRTTTALNALLRLAKVAGKSGLKIVATPAAAGSSAAALNAAPAGTVTKTVKLQLQDADGVLQTWYNGSDVTLTPVETVADVDVGAPAVTGGTVPAFVDGEALVNLTYDTNAGATKTYLAGETVGFTTACANILGRAVTVGAPANFTDTLVA